MLFNERSTVYVDSEPSDGIEVGHPDLPIYEVEFIFAERRMFDRCDALQRIKNRIDSGDRRYSPGRRLSDWLLVSQAFA
jgi:hypothetical protein